MNINPLSNNNPFYSRNLSDKTSESKEKSGTNSKIQDKLELSEEAKKLQGSNTDVKNLDEIKSKIASKFYDSNEVLNKVADKILKEIK